ncbi:hypothetical protein RAAC3_TM7C00001G0157 [Candidatus Saccharibacteria bacterium RAAC3_TM7_1]|nr:hypothetical protein RAAC3_TM7C00001G0157 [Candidatus Saccharibacteria bacterium RAAC3_TM7_1]
MPSRNVLKIDITDSIYHVYARGRGRQKIYRDEADFEMFLTLFSRSLSLMRQYDRNHHPYPHLRGQVELLSYCLMPNHFHLLVYQADEGGMTQLMRSVLASYSRYFNKRYGLSGALLEGTYRASRLSDDEQVRLVSRYIHLDPKDWQAHPYSSIHAWYGIGRPEWLQPERVISLFPSLPHYADFLDDQAGYKASLTSVKEELANTIA